MEKINLKELMLLIVIIMCPIVLKWLPTVDYGISFFLTLFTVLVVPIIYFIFLISNIIFVFSKKKIIYLYRLIALFISTLLLFSNITDDFILKFNYYSKYNKRMDIIDKIKNNEFIINKFNQVELPSRYNNVAYKGIVEYEEINGGYMVKFLYIGVEWTGGDSDYIIYSSSDEVSAVIREMDAENIKQIDKNWFYIYGLDD